MTHINTSNHPAAAPFLSQGVIVNRRFVVHSMLGKGGFGDVYLAFDRELGQICALKMLRQDISCQPYLRESFVNEAKMWLSLGKHPNVVSARAVDVFNGQLFIALEYIAPDDRGINTLDQAISKRSIPITLALKWAIEVASGLLHGYNHGLVAHRDLKPSNIMLDSGDRALITDFSLANYHLAPTRSRLDKSISGTPLYMAPEQFIDGGLCDQRSDIYSFGIVLYQLLHRGALPFDVPDSDPQAYFAVLRYVHNSYEVPRFDSPLYSVIQKCLNKATDTRYQHAGDLLGDLERIHVEATGRKFRQPTDSETTAWELNNHAVSFFMLGDVSHALSIIDRSLQLNPELNIAINNKASFLAHSGRIQEAVTLWTSLSRCAPSLGRSFYNLGNVLMGAQNFESAIGRFQQCIMVEPDYVPALANLAICYQKVGNQAEALRAYDKAIHIAPNDALLRYNIGVLLVENARYNDALSWLLSAASLDPTYVSTFNYVGLCYLGLGEYQRAIIWFDKALAMNPSYEHAINNRALAVASLLGTQL